MRYSVETPLRSVITGIDGAGKSTTASIVASDIGTHYRLVEPGPSRPVFSVIQGEKRYHFERLTKSIDSLHNLADRSGRLGFISVVNSINVILSGRVVEPTLRQRFKPEVILGARDYFIDPSVYSIIYQPLLAGRPMSKRIDLLGEITGVPFCNVIFFLTVPPEEAIVRIEKRIVREKAEAGMNYREKWRHIHENPESLSRLQSEYYDALGVIQDKSPAKIFEINTFGMPQVQVADFIATTIRNHMGNRSFGNSSDWVKIEREPVVPRARLVCTD